MPNPKKVKKNHSDFAVWHFAVIKFDTRRVNHKVTTASHWQSKYQNVVRLFVFFNDFLIWLFNDGVSIGTIGCSADDTMIDECGEIRGMRICRENQSTQ